MNRAKGNQGDGHELSPEAAVRVWLRWQYQLLFSTKRWTMSASEVGVWTRQQLRGRDMELALLDLVDAGLLKREERPPKTGRGRPVVTYTPVENYAKASMVKKTYGRVVVQTYKECRDMARPLIEKVLLERGGQATQGDLSRRLGYLKMGSDRLIAILDEMREEGILRKENQPTGRVGRPTAWWHMVNKPEPPPEEDYNDPFQFIPGTKRRININSLEDCRHLPL